MNDNEELYTDQELEQFIGVLSETIVKHNISISMIEKCLPIMGEVRDYGLDLHDVLSRGLYSLTTRTGC